VYLRALQLWYHQPQVENCKVAFWFII
jgi:hypothetical protein